MILTGEKILNEIDWGGIQIDPFNKDNVGPNSYDVTLNEEFMIYHSEGQLIKEWYIDSKQNNETHSFKINDKGYVLRPNKLYLARTNERTFTDKYVPMLEGKSSLGRLGINIHATAGFGDIGFNGFWTLEISVIHPVKIYPNMKIGQLYFMEVSGNRTIQYNGKYQNNTGVEASKNWMDK